MYDSSTFQFRSHTAQCKKKSSFIIDLLQESCSEYFIMFIACLNYKLKQNQMDAYQ